jgi:hypothetical protein
MDVANDASRPVNGVQTPEIQGPAAAMPNQMM